MKDQHHSRAFKILFILLVAGFIFSCKSNHQKLSAADSLSVNDSVSMMMTNVSRDISAKGPVAWLQYFENSPDFFMSSGGKLAFHDYKSARIFVQDTLVKFVQKISLRWGNVRIDPLTPALAAVGAAFHEDMVIAGGKTGSYDGYFSGTAHRVGNSWKLRNANWSIKVSK